MFVEGSLCFPLGTGNFLAVEELTRCSSRYSDPMQHVPFLLLGAWPWAFCGSISKP